jgi:hypothetical protein
MSVDELETANEAALLATLRSLSPNRENPPASVGRGAGGGDEKVAEDAQAYEQAVQLIAEMVEAFWAIAEAGDGWMPPNVDSLLDRAAQFVEASR